MNGAKVMLSVSSTWSDDETRNDSQCFRISLRNNLTWLWIIIMTGPWPMKITGLKLILYFLHRHSRGPTRAHTTPRSWDQDNHDRKGWGYARVWQRRPAPSTDNVGHTNTQLLAAMSLNTTKSSGIHLLFGLFNYCCSVQNWTKLFCFYLLKLNGYINNRRLCTSCLLLFVWFSV
jgi:hypothetical protein